MPKNSEKWLSQKLTRHQINNIYGSSITYGDSSSNKYDTFQAILPIKINEPDCNIFNKKGHLSRANISRVKTAKELFKKTSTSLSADAAPDFRLNSFL